MNTQLKRLNALSKIIDIEAFYDISFTANEISIQGRFNNELTLILINNKFKFWSITQNGHIEFKRAKNGVRCVLT